MADLERKHRLVILESPYAGDIDINLAYARACLRDSLSRGEAPIASHLLYTQRGVLRDEVPEERQWGINAGLAWLMVAERTVVYTNLGISRGMMQGISAAQENGVPVEYRQLVGPCVTNPEQIVMDHEVDAACLAYSQDFHFALVKAEFGCDESERLHAAEHVKFLRSRMRKALEAALEQRDV